MKNMAGDPMLENVAKALQKVGIPVVYHHFKGEMPLPSIVYFVESKKHGGADDRACLTRLAVTVELYSDQKDQLLEQRLESILDDLNSEYQAYEDYIDSEKVFRMSYDIEFYYKK